MSDHIEWANAEDCRVDTTGEGVQLGDGNVTDFPALVIETGSASVVIEGSPEHLSQLASKIQRAAAAVCRSETRREAH